MPAPSAVEHCRTVLGAIIPARRDLLDKALRHLTPEHFPDLTQRNVFIMLERYADVAGAVLTRSALGDILKGQDSGRALLYDEVFSELEATLVDDSAFSWSIAQIRELAAERATMEALTRGLTIVTSGVDPGKGAPLLKGHADGRNEVLSSFAQIDRDLSMQDAPEGDLRTEATDMMADYATRKHLRATGRSQGIRFGIPELDFRIGGLQPGELDLFVGYAGEGKTSLAVQTSWSCAVEQGHNAVIMTTETLRPQVRRKLIARHSRLPHFELPEGIDTRDLKNGTLPEALEPKLADVVNDLAKNPAYGHIYVAQVPRGATIGTIEAKLARVARMWHVDFCVIDYLALLASERTRQDSRQESSDIVKAAKQLAATFDDGAGVPIISPWQVNRSSYEEALKTGYYSLKALSDTGEAEKSSDIVVSLLAPAEQTSRYAQLKTQVMKNRDGERASAIILDVDYATSTLKDQAKSTAMTGLLEV